jgi:hypothetical protein
MKELKVSSFLTYLFSRALAAPLSFDDQIPKERTGGFAPHPYEWFAFISLPKRSQQSHATAFISIELP